MKGKLRTAGAALFTVVFTLAAVAVASAHHEGLYLNYDAGQQRPESGKENYAHLWWVQYNSHMYWKAESALRNDVVSSIGNWTTSIPELTWAERPSDYDIEFKLGDCPDNSDFFGCVADRSFSNDSRADANYQDTAVVWIQDRSDWGVGGRQSVIAHELGHLYGMHEAYIENANNPCNSARTSIMDGVTTDANNKIVHCDGLTGPNTTDVSVVEAMYRTGQMGSMTASSSGTSATFT